jgi:biopolymer transport protein ExbD
MAQIDDSGGGGHDKKGKKRAKKGSTHVDMTPLVDLAFLLLTFFVLTSTFSDPKVMSLTYPAKPKPEDVIDKDKAKVNNAITFLLSKDKIYYYEGEFYAPGNPKGMPPTKLEETDFSATGVRKLLIEKNSYVLSRKAPLMNKLNQGKINDAQLTEELKTVKGNKDALKVLIKTDSKATCRNFIDLIDELKINDIGVMAPVDLMKSEEELIKAKGN